jgi:hypothetical protein
MEGFNGSTAITEYLRTARPKRIETVIVNGMDTAVKLCWNSMEVMTVKNGGHDITNRRSRQKRKEAPVEGNLGQDAQGQRPEGEYWRQR